MTTHSKSQTSIHRTCHKGPTLVVESNGLELYGASRNEAEFFFYDFDLVISLEVCIPRKMMSNLSSIGLQRLTKREAFTEHFVLRWPDFGVPTYTKEFWERLSYQLRKKGRDRDRFNRKYKVMVHCMGGHGRTGTALAILASMCSDDEIWQSDDLIERIREKHCKHAVENQKQVGYIEEILERKLRKGEGSKDYLFADGCKYNNETGLSFSSFSKENTSRKGSKIRGYEPITQVEKDKRKREKEVKERWFNEKGWCYKHNQLACRNCKDDMKRENERLEDLEMEARKLELQQRLESFLKPVDSEVIVPNVIPSTEGVEKVLEKIKDREVN